MESHNLDLCYGGQRRGLWEALVEGLAESGKVEKAWLRREHYK